VTTDIQPKNAFLLEPHENLAYFTVLERKTAMLKLVFPPPSSTRASAPDA